MADQIQQTRQVNSDGTASVRTTELVDNTNNDDRVASKDSIASRVVWLIAGIIITLLAFRFVLILLGANSESGFANLIYTVSHPFAAPFFGLFNYQQQYGESKFELSTLVAMAVYALVAFGISKLITIRQPRQ